MTSALRVAAAQEASVSGDVTANVATAVRLVDEAAHAGARVVVLPELFLTGYDVEAWSPAAALSPEDPRLGPLRAARPDVVVLVGAAVRRPGGPTISVLAVSDGTVRVAYDKQHLCGAEREHFVAGERGGSVVVDGWELGLGVCYDGCFPEHAAAAARDGAQAYLCPAAYFVGSEHRRDLYYAARALDNGIYVVLAGLSGRCGAWEFNGGSAVYDPEGRPVERADAQPGVVVAELDVVEVRRVQREHPMGRERRADLAERSRLVLS